MAYLMSFKDTRDDDTVYAQAFAFLEEVHLSFRAKRASWSYFLYKTQGKGNRGIQGATLGRKDYSVSDADFDLYFSKPRIKASQGIEDQCDIASAAILDTPSADGKSMVSFFNGATKV